MINTSTLVKRPISFILSTLGITLLGYLGYRTVLLIRERSAKTHLLQKLLNNTIKTFKECEKGKFLRLEPPSLNEILNHNPRYSLNVEHFEGEAKSGKDKMQDAHFYNENEQGILMGVFDGCGGCEVAEYAKDNYQEEFFKNLNNNNGNIRKAFELSFQGIHEHVKNQQDWNSMGATAVISFIDKKTHHIYTASLGSGLADIYRSINQELQVGSLACERNWSSKKDYERAIAINPELKKEWTKERRKNPNHLRFPRCGQGVNFSRGIGVLSVELSDKPAIIQKPKITINLVKPGDIVVLGSKGLKERVNEKEIISKLNENTDNLKNNLVEYAKSKQGDHDLTILVLKVSEKA